MLDVSFFTEELEQANLVFDVLSFIHEETFHPSSQLDKSQLLWMRTAVNAIVDILNEYVNHSFTKDSQKACEDFLKQSFDHLGSASSMKLVNFFRVIIGFANNFSLGIVLVTLLLEEVRRTGEWILQGFYHRTSAREINETFQVYTNLLNTLLPNFTLVATSVVGVGSGVKDKLVIPKVSLGEIRRFSLYLDNWEILVDCVLLGFSQVSKEASTDLRQVKKKISDIKKKIFPRS